MAFESKFSSIGSNQIGLKPEYIKYRIIRLPDLITFLFREILQMQNTAENVTFIHRIKENLQLHRLNK